MNLPGRSKVIGFADDVAIVVVGKTIREAEETADAAIAAVQLWLSAAGLCLALPKIEAVLSPDEKGGDCQNFYGRYRDGLFPSHQISRCYARHKAQLQRAPTRSEQNGANVCRALRRIMLHTRGPKLGRRLLLRRYYSAPIWGEATSVKAYKRGIPAKSSMRKRAGAQGNLRLPHDFGLVRH